MIKYSHNTVKEIDVYRFLSICDTLFSPILSEVVNIKAYANKLYNYADFFEAKDNDNLIGLLTIYLNNEEKRTGYISTLCIEAKYQGIGIARKLMSQVINYSGQISFNFLELEVYNSNKEAFNFYKSIGFRKFKELNNSCLMRFTVK